MAEDKSNYEAAALEVALAILTHDFSLRERDVLAAILVASYGHPLRPHTEAFFPGLPCVARVARMSKGNAHVILDGLKRSLVVEQHPNGFGFRLPIAQWKVREKLDAAALREFLPLQFERDDLQGALRDTFLDSHTAQHLPTHAVQADRVRPDRSASIPDAGFEVPGVVVPRESAGSGRSPGNGQPVGATGQGYPAPLALTSAVPDSGTGPQPEDNSEGGSRFGNHAERAGPARVLNTVPNSGTNSPSLQACNLGTTQVCTKVTSTKERTLQPCRLAPDALEEERQSVFDELGTLGVFGKRDGSKYNWLALVKRVPLQELQELLGDLRYRLGQRHLKPLGNPGGWLNREGMRRGLW